MPQLRLPAALMLVTCNALAWAGGNTSPSLAPGPIAQAMPAIDPASALSGAVLLEALRKGGFVLYVRHAETGAITDHCDTSNLSPGGVGVARELGAQLSRLRIPVGNILSSPVCRVQETARLLSLGEVTLTDDLAQAGKMSGADLYAARIRRLSERPRTGTNTIAVGHMHAGVPKYQTMELEFGETIVYLPDGKATPRPVARIRAGDWKSMSGTSGGAVQK